MKKVTIKTEELQEAYNILSSAKMTKMSDADKIKTWKIARAMKPIATKFEEDKSDAAKTLKPKDEKFEETLSKVQEFERMMHSKEDMSKAPIGAAEYNAFIIDVWQPYNKLVDEAIKPLAGKEVELEIDALSEEAFGLLMASNDWRIATVVGLGDIITE